MPILEILDWIIREMRGIDPVTAEHNDTCTCYRCEEYKKKLKEIEEMKESLR